MEIRQEVMKDLLGYKTYPDFDDDDVLDEIYGVYVSDDENDEETISYRLYQPSVESYAANNCANNCPAGQIEIWLVDDLDDNLVHILTCPVDTSIVEIKEYLKEWLEKQAPDGKVLSGIGGV